MLAKLLLATFCRGAERGHRLLDVRGVLRCQLSFGRRDYRVDPVAILVAGGGDTALQRSIVCLRPGQPSRRVDTPALPFRDSVRSAPCRLCEPADDGDTKQRGQEDDRADLRAHGVACRAWTRSA